MNVALGTQHVGVAHRVARAGVVREAWRGAAARVGVAHGRIRHNSSHLDFFCSDFDIGAEPATGVVFIPKVRVTQIAKDRQGLHPYKARSAAFRVSFTLKSEERQFTPRLSFWASFVICTTRTDKT